MPTTDGRTSRRPRGRWTLLAALVVLAVGLGAYFLQSPDVVAGQAAAPTVQQDAPSAPVPSAVPARPVRGMPTRLVVPALDVDAPVVPVRTVGRVLIPPSDPQQLGWWAQGARPGAARGSALIAGHTVHTGGGAFDRLGDLHAGDQVRVRTDHGWIDYVVRSVEVRGKGITAQRAEQLFSQKVPGRLVLITCADWNGSRYLSNALVTATQTSS